MVNQHAEAKATAQKRSSGSTGENTIAAGAAAQIRDAMVTAKNLTASLDAREQADRLRALRSQRVPVLQANMQVAESLLALVLEKSHFDADKLKAIQSESRAELRRILQA